MRILYSHRIQSRDGQSVHVEELVAASAQEGHEVLVVGPGFHDTVSLRRREHAWSPDRAGCCPARSEEFGRAGL